MICWNRFISYIYRYHKNEKCENTGFAKVQKHSGNGKIQIGLKDILERRDETYLVYIYRETLASDQVDHESIIPKLQLLGNLKMRGGRGEGSFVFDWNNVMGSGKPMTAWSGILIRKREQDSFETAGNRDIFCSSWTDNHVDYSRAFEEENQDEQEMIDVYYDETISVEEDLPVDADESIEIDQIGQIGIETEQEVLDIDIEKIEEALEIAEEAVSSTNAIQEQNTIYEFDDDSASDVSSHENTAEEILATHEKLPLLPAYDRVNGTDAEIFECVKITPNDIGLLDMENWRLGVNSFLTHGFYYYQYLMFGRVVFQGGEKSHSYILGVPGIYSSKEKYLADIFGFDRFVPSQETMVKTGSFGYWIVDIKN